VRDVAPPPRYVALSYCSGVGGFLPPKLLTENIEIYERGVPISFLPQKFQDTCRVATSVGCQYIWIDSLCIMHDSDNDKSSELSKMKDIFENCYLAIAAADGEDCSSGLFIPRPSSWST
jgi:hypothetical protein